MKYMKRILALLMFAALLAGCKGQNPLDLIRKPISQTTASPTASLHIPEPTQSAVIKPGDNTFGRFSAMFGDMFIYVRDQEVMALQGSTPVKLFDLPKQEILEDIMIVDEKTLYFSMQTPETMDKGHDRKLYKAVAMDGSYVVEQTALIQGPILGKGSSLYFQENDNLTVLDTQNGAIKNCIKLPNQSQLLNWGWFDGKVLYYSVYEKADESGILYGSSELYRMELSNYQSVKIADVNKPLSQTFTMAKDGMLYQYKLSEDGLYYNLRILDSYLGSMDTVFTVPKAILADRLGSEYMYRVDDTVYLLMTGTQAAPSDNPDFLITAYQLTPAQPNAAVLWTTAIPSATDHLSSYFMIHDQADRMNHQIIVMTEEINNTNQLMTLNAADGKIESSVDVAFKNAQKTRQLRIMDGAVLVYSMLGEDYPRASLEYISVKTPIWNFIGTPDTAK